MERKHLYKLKRTGKKPLSECHFAPAKKGKLPKPLDRLGGPRLKVTPVYDVGDGLKVIFVWKTGPYLETRSLYGRLFQETERGMLPIVRLDYHPSHKNLHVKVNCETEIDLVNRDLVKTKEFSLTNVALDPDIEEDRLHFVAIFCERFGIRLGNGELL